MRILGVDVGCSGALALLSDGALIDVLDFPLLHIKRGKTEKAEIDGYELAHIIKSLQVEHALIERVGGMTGQSASAAFNFGRAVGAVEYTLKSLGIPTQSVPPQVWKKYFRLKGSKDESRALASSLYPAKANQFCRKKDDGRAEAALIATYLYKTEYSK